MSITGWLQGLEDRVERLETWAGPGQIEALAEGQRAIRADIAKLQASVDRHEKLLVRLTRDVSGLKTHVAGLETDVAGLKTDVAVLKTDVAVLKRDMGEVKATLLEILRRLPDQSAPN